MFSYFLECLLLKSRKECFQVTLRSITTNEISVSDNYRPVILTFHYALKGLVTDF